MRGDIFTEVKIRYSKTTVNEMPNLSYNDMDRVRPSPAYQRMA